MSPGEWTRTSPPRRVTAARAPFAATPPPRTRPRTCARPSPTAWSTCTGLLVRLRTGLPVVTVLTLGQIRAVVVAERELVRPRAVRAVGAVVGEKPPPVEDLVVVPVLLAVRGALVLGPPSVVHEDASLKAGRVLVRALERARVAAVLELGALSLTLLDGSQRRGDDVCVGGVVEARVPSRCALFCPAMIRGPTHVRRFFRPSVSRSESLEGVTSNGSVVATARWQGIRSRRSPALFP